MKITWLADELRIFYTGCNGGDSMKIKVNILGAAAAGIFAVASAVIGEMNQQKAIDEAIEKRLHQEEESDEEEEES